MNETSRDAWRGAAPGLRTGQPADALPHPDRSWFLRPDGTDASAGMHGVDPGDLRIFKVREKYEAYLARE